MFVHQLIIIINNNKRSFHTQVKELAWSLTCDSADHNEANDADNNDDASEYQ